MDKKNKGGRPTAYSREVQEAAEHYINGGYRECGDMVPSRAGLCVELSVCRETLTNWGRMHPKFLGALERLSVVQERVSLSGGLSGSLNSAIVKLLLANHGYNDKQAIEHTGDGLKPASADISAAVVAALRAKHQTG